MKYILTLLALFIILTATAQTKSVDTTAGKEILQDADYGYLLEIAKENIINAELDDHRINTYRWYISLVSTKWGTLLTLWIDKHYPHLKNKKLN